MQSDFEDLERRNQKQLDKLLEMLKNNPEEALKYAIPIDPNGSTRGGAAMELELGRRWNNFSLLGNSFSGGIGGTINLGDGTELLSRQYRETAQRLKDEGNYQKAAFVYMKLLKDYYSAASTLEEGGFYNEAAIIYKKHCYNDAKAAECYEKGNYTNEAIELYVKVNNFEKAGDLLSKLKKTKEANFYYEKTADAFIANNKYLKASEVYKNKMNDSPRAQEVLLSGWRNGRDSVNCLRLYLSEYQDKKQLMDKLNTLNKEELTAVNSTSFLQAVKHFYNEKDESAPKMKELVYEIVAQHVNANIDLVSELKNFSKTDTHLAKDAIKYKLNRNRLR